MKKLRIVISLLLATALLSACTATTPGSGAPTPVPTTPPDQTPVPMPVATTQPDIAPSGTPVAAAADEAEQEQSPVSVTVTVRDGDTLERDIIPQVSAALSIPARLVEDAFSQAQSELIGSSAQGFRRMEGMILPGTYDVTGLSVNGCVAMWISEAEQRYARIAGKATRPNTLSAAERLTLGSIVEAETVLADRFERDVAAIFLNRLAADEPLCSDATVEYALGLERPYLTSGDIKTVSDYNTYKSDGLPPGPICAMDDESLAAATALSKKSSTWYFFYDYVLKKIMVFADYEKFRAESDASVARFEETYTVGRFDEVDKRQYFGG